MIKHHFGPSDFGWKSGFNLNHCVNIVFMGIHYYRKRNKGKSVVDHTSRILEKRKKRIEWIIFGSVDLFFLNIKAECPPNSKRK